MEIVHGLPQPINGLPTVLTIGAFDGVHRGHQHLIGGAIQRARALDYQSAVLTFDPHPDMLLQPAGRRLYLSSLEERIELIDALGTDLLIVLPFTRDIMALDARAFMSQVCRTMALRELWIGWDFALGRGRDGSAARLREIGQELGYQVYPVDALTLENGLTVSSTHIRTALQAGDVATARVLLGHPFSLRGSVIEGDRRGRTIGFPTANIAVNEQHMLPADSVYICHAWLGDERYGAVTNIGIRPTFAGKRRTIEAYLLDFAGDIYGEELRLDFLHRLRGEQKFDGVAALVAQINVDVSLARNWLKTTS